MSNLILSLLLSLLLLGCTSPAPRHFLIIDLSASNITKVYSPQGKAVIEKTLEAAGDFGLDVFVVAEEMLYLRVDDTLVTADELLRRAQDARAEQARNKVYDTAYRAAEKHYLPEAQQGTNKFGIGTDPSPAFFGVAARAKADASPAVITALIDGHTERLYGAATTEAEIWQCTQQAVEEMMRLPNVRLYLCGISQEYRVGAVDEGQRRLSVADRWRELLIRTTATDLSRDPTASRGFLINTELQLDYESLTAPFSHRKEADSNGTP